MANPCLSGGCAGDLPRAAAAGAAAAGRRRHPDRRGAGRARRAARLRRRAGLRVGRRAAGRRRRARRRLARARGGAGADGGAARRRAVRRAGGQPDPRRAAVLGLAGRPRRPAGRVHSPAGLDIGGRTAAEIALSILAEMVQERRAAERHAAAAPVPASAVDPVCGMTVAAVDSSPHVTDRRRDDVVLLRGLPDGVPDGPGALCRPPPEAPDGHDGRSAPGGGAGAEDEVRPRVPDVETLAAALDDVDYLADPGWPPRCSWPCGCRSRCCWRASPGSARPRRRRRWPGCWTPRWSGCSATRASTPPRRCTSGTTPASCWASGWPRPRHDAAGRGRPVRRRLPAAPPAAAGARAPGPAPGGAAARRDRPRRRRVRGVHLRAAGRGGGDRPGARHDPGDAPAGRGADLQPHPRPARRAEPALPLPLDRLPGARARRRDRPAAGARQRRAAGAGRGRRGHPAALARPGEAARASPRRSTGWRR